MYIYGGPHCNKTNLFLVINSEVIINDLRGIINTGERAHCAMGRRFDPLWWYIELVIIPASPTRLCNKGCGMYYPVYGMVHILLIEKRSQ